MDVDRWYYYYSEMSEGMLQWSHVLMDVDSDQLGRRLHSERSHASMEPRPDGRG